MITKLSQLIEAAKSGNKRRMAVAYAADEHTIDAAFAAVSEGIIEAVLVGNKECIVEICRAKGIDPTVFTIVEEKSDVASAARAVGMASRGEVDILMKGSITTDKYMRAILSKDTGLLPPKSILTHVAVLEMPAYHKLLTISDVAIIPYPDMQQKIFITKSVIATAQAMGIETPKVAIISATEQVLTGLQSCVDASVIAKMGDRGQLGNAIIDGPLSVDVSLDKESAQIKKVKSAVAAEADGMVFPSLDAANAFFKAATKLGGASLAGLVVGAKVPCVLTSRGDSEESKLNSIALAVITCNNKG